MKKISFVTICSLVFVTLLFTFVLMPERTIAAGEKIVFASNQDGNFEIYTMNSDGTDLTRLTFNPAIDSYPAWSPGGRKIAFASYRDGNYEIYVMNSNGTDVVRLTNNTASDISRRGLQMAKRSHLSQIGMVMMRSIS